MPPLETDIERGLHYHARRHVWSGTETPDLTMLDGVGPAIAKRLRAAGIDRPEDLQGKSIEEIAAIDGIGRALAARIRSQVEYTMPKAVDRPIVSEAADGERTLHGMLHTTRRIDARVGGETGVEDDDLERFIPYRGNVADVPVSPEHVGVTGDDKDRALEANAERSLAARRADESFNAPITLSYAQWAAHPDRYDYPGVDTIPRSVKRKRALSRTKRLVDEGAITSFHTDESWSSSYQRGMGRLSLGASEDPEGVFAHEMGHAVSYSLRTTDQAFDGRYPSEDLFEDPESLEQAERLLERRRGEPVESTRHTYGLNVFEGTDWEEAGERSEGKKDAEFKDELFADVFASMVTEPRAARREAPKAVAEVENLVHGSGYLYRGHWPDLEADL